MKEMRIQVAIREAPATDRFNMSGFDLENANIKTQMER
jgi:hypothetical protein